jgi:hypothetical protein
MTGTLTRTSKRDTDVATQLSLRYGVPVDALEKVLTNIGHAARKSFIAAHCCIDREGLQAVAIEMLVHLCSTYDVTKEKSFLGYATLRCKGAMIDELRRAHIMHNQGKDGIPSVVSTSEAIFDDDDDLTIGDMLTDDSHDATENVDAVRMELASGPTCISGTAC